MSYFRRTVKTAAVLTVLFVLGCFLEILPNQMLFLRNSASFYFLILSIGLLLYFKNTVVDKEMRGYLTAVAVMIVLWIVMRIVKYSSFSESDFMTRMLWYAFYIPMLCIPYFSFGAAMELGKDRNDKTHTVMIITGLITLIFIGIVLTNDLHGLIFIFDNGFDKELQNYSYGILFWIITVWSYITLIVSLAVVVIKSQVTESRRLSWIILLYSVLFAAWLVCLSLDIRPKILGNNYGEFPETVCFLVGGLWLLCLKAGLVPFNSGYGKLFSATSLSVMITDADYKLVYKSKSALPMTKEQLAKSDPFLLNENTRVFRHAVSGGFAYWQVDLTKLNKTNKRLDDVHEALGEEKELIRLENELKQKRAEIDAKSKTYDNIAVKVLPQSKTVDVLVNETREAPMLFTENMRIVAIYICYIKRMSNLMLMASEKEMLCRDELSLALSETVRYLNKVGLIAAVHTDEENPMLPANHLIEAYAAFQRILEEALPTVRAISATLINDILKITVEGESVALPDGVAGICEIDDDTTFIKIFLSGEAKQ